MEKLTKEIWVSGEYRNLDICKTQEGYYKAIADLVEREGNPVGKRMLLVRSIGGKEFDSKAWGASWTNNLLVCFYRAQEVNCQMIVVTAVDADEKAVHFGMGEYNKTYEEEYLIDMEKHHNPVYALAVYCENSWNTVKDGEDSINRETLKAQYPEEWEALNDYQYYADFMKMRQDRDKIIAEAKKTYFKEIRENRALCIMKNYETKMFAPKNGTVTKTILAMVLENLGCNSSVTKIETRIPGVTSLAFTVDGVINRVFISSKLARVL